ncbi:ECF transporter S component [Ruminiclostridium herbifermentans]|uniref:ECF transporter S component n=1 Tax=Ruminiclostridium herbifermentans TaxID=2488810 RepID=A0A4U7JFZ7_9FIRM|nr:ECF transporter S component [Ruminiclostridium herbifermentans]QNU65862.1 ECF transporter S component [Ruminiclostridium herbifermentans]
MNNKVLWITRTAALTALLIVMQAATSSLGNTLVTGSIVNLILIVSVMTCGVSTGITVGIISPVCAKLFGIGPFWSLIPFIIAGNIVLIILWHIIGNCKMEKFKLSYVLALIVAAVAKFLVLYLGIVKLAIPVFLKLPEQKAIVVSNMFSIPQLITALIGGVLALIVLPVLKRAIKFKG